MTGQSNRGPACVGKARPKADPWFPDNTQESAAAVAYGIAVCRRCPVMDACLTEAMDFETKYPRFRYGTFGGLTADQRADLARVVRGPTQDRPKATQGQPERTESAT